MKILVVNCGSSSIKYKLYDFPQKRLIFKDSIEKIGESGSSVINHTQGLEVLVSDLLKKTPLKSLKDISAVGHRIVHGGEAFAEPCLINDKVLTQIKRNVQLAPLHNPANLAGIEGCRKFFPNIPQIAVFDTAFHQTIPEYAYMYALPRSYYQKYKVRKYGFHGTSHQFIAHRASELLKKPLTKLKLITCHLGNGCSITAIDKGKSLDTSMGFTPLEGLMMGTRTGDIDPAVVLYIMEKEKIPAVRMEAILNKKSGLLGVSGISNDFRLIKEGLRSGNKRAKLAYEMFIYRIKKYIGAYYFILGGADAVCFTGGIGENSTDVYKLIKKEVLRIVKHKISFLVIPTDEELMIANLTYTIVSKKPIKKEVKK